MRAQRMELAAVSPLRTFTKYAAPLLLSLIVILFYWKLTLTTQYSWMESPDLAYQVLPWFQFQAAEWHHGRVPLWDPNSYAGQPLLGQALPEAAYPLNWLLYALPLHAGCISERALDWYFVLTRLLAALACYALCRELGRSRAASIIGGCAFALGGYMANMTWPQKANGAVWAPLVLLYFIRAVRGERPWPSALLSGFFLGVSYLSGHHELPVFLTLAMIALWSWSCLRDKFSGGPIHWSRARMAAASIGVAVLASGMQTLPMTEYGARAVRWVGAPNDPLGAGDTVPYSVHEKYALKPIGLLGVILPNMDDSPTSPYVGSIVLSLGILGAILAWREAQARWLAALAAGGIVFALGGSSLLHGALYAVLPLLDKARSPGAATLIFALGLAPLVAYGVDEIPQAASAVWSRRIGRVLIGLAIVLSLVSLVFFLAKVEPAIADNRIMITALCALLGAGLLAAWRADLLPARAGSAALLALVLFELANVPAYWLAPKNLESRSVYVRRLAQHADIAAFLHTALEKDGDARIEYDDNEIPYNFGDWWSLDTFTSDGASVPANIWKLDLFTPRGRNFFGIRYTLGKTQTREGQREVFQGSSGVKVFENPGAYPRVWSVHDAIAMFPGQAPRDVFAYPPLDPRRTAFFAPGPLPQLAACDPAADRVQMPIHGANFVRIDAHMGCRGMVILSDTWFPGWRATVDGKSVPIEQAYTAVRGVTVDAGDHVIEMRYRPLSGMIGAGMTLAAGLLVLLARAHANKLLPAGLRWTRLR